VQSLLIKTQLTISEILIYQNKKELKSIIEIKSMIRIVYDLINFEHLIGKNDGFHYISTVIDPMNKWA
jgi:hypothetical protein